MPTGNYVNKCMHTVEFPTDTSETHHGYWLWRANIADSQYNNQITAPTMLNSCKGRF